MRALPPLIVIAVLAACDPGGWRRLETGADARLEGVYVAGEEQILAVGSRGTVLTYDGKDVTDTSTDSDDGPRVPGFYGVVSTGGVLRVAGDQGTVLSRTTGPYTKEDSRTLARLLMMMPATPSIVYAAGEEGRVIKKVVGTERWQRIDINAGDNKITGGWAISDEAIAFCTDSGVVIDRVDDQWVTTPIGTGTTALPLFDVWSSTAGADMYAVGLAGTILKRAAGDVEFLPEESPITSDLYGIYGSAPDRIFAVGARGTIVEWDGIEWKAVPSGTSQDLFDIHATPDGKLFVASGDDGTLVILQE